MSAQADPGTQGERAAQYRERETTAPLRLLLRQLLLRQLLSSGKLDGSAILMLMALLAGPDQ